MSWLCLVLVVCLLACRVGRVCDAKTTRRGAGSQPWVFCAVVLTGGLGLGAWGLGEIIGECGVRRS